MALPNSPELEKLLEQQPELRERVEREYQKYLEAQGLDVQATDVDVNQAEDLPLCPGLDCPINTFFLTSCCMDAPAGFEFASFAVKTSFTAEDVVCSAEPFCAVNVGTIDSPCGPIQGGLTEVFAIRATGTLTVLASLDVSNRPSCPNNPTISQVCCEIPVCLNNIVCLSTNPDACPDFCDTFVSGFVNAVLFNSPCRRI